MVLKSAWLYKVVHILSGDKYYLSIILFLFLQFHIVNTRPSDPACQWNLIVVKHTKVDHWRFYKKSFLYKIWELYVENFIIFTRR
jgi:hypothetical protein